MAVSLLAVRETPSPRRLPTSRTYDDVNDQRPRRTTSSASRPRQRARPRRAAVSFSAPSMGIDLEVKVLSEIGHNDRSEPQGRNREGPSGGSGERNRGPTYRNRIRGVAEQGERAEVREALVTEARRRISGGRAVKVDVLTWGDLASRLKGRRRGRESRRSEKSAEAVVAAKEPGRATPEPRKPPSTRRAKRRGGRSAHGSRRRKEATEVQHGATGRDAR